MEQAGAEQRLAAEPAALARRHVVAHDLEGHVALEHAVLGLVDVAHPPAPTRRRTV